MLLVSEDLGIVGLKNFQYLNNGGTFSVEGVNDKKDFEETVAAMKVMGFSDVEQREIWSIVSAVLHLGNVNFVERGNYAQVEDLSETKFQCHCAQALHTLC